MKTLEKIICLVLAMQAAQFAKADLVGNYTADANTLFLLHFDEAAGGSVTANAGSKGGNFYTVVNATGTGNGSATPTVSTVMLGAAGYLNGATNFHNCFTNPVAGGMAGYDFNNSGAYQGEVSTATASPDRLAMTNLNMGFGGRSPWTIEANILVANTNPPAGMEIICTDSIITGQRGFQFRISGRQLQFASLTGTTMSLAGNLPTTGNDAYTTNTWYHVAATYDGTTLTLYWTLLNGTNGAAHILISGPGTMDATFGVAQAPLIIGNENRSASSEQFQGCIDEVRISSVCRGSGQMQFYSPLVTITQNPVSQNVDYNQPVTFSVGAASQFALGYQWRFNSNSIAGATNTSYVITNVAAANRGYYDCVVTNTAAYTATSSPALLVVGAANFIANRYSFTTDASDSIGGQNGTLFGNATVTGGALVLDGTSGTYMQLPPNLYSGANATALTVEFWATYGTSSANVYPFAFGNTNFINGQGIVGVACVMYNSHSGTGQTFTSIATDPNVNGQSVSGAGSLDGRTVHVACVIDPPNNTLAIYTNGVLEAINTNYTGVSIAGLNDQLSYIGRSLWPTDPYLNASIDELRIFKGALSSISIKQSDDQGPNTLLADGPAKYTLQPANTSVPAGQTATFTAATVGYLPITYQWFKNGTLIPNATNASYSYATVIGDNGATFLVQATNTVGVTTYVTNSATATLTVFIPPTLAWLGTADGGADNSWNTTSLDWTNDLSGGGIIAFAQTNGVLFDDRSGGGAVDLEQAIAPYSITASNTATYILTSSGALGSLTGLGKITKQNSGNLTIDLTNNLTGLVTISGGTLQVGNNDANGSLGSGTVTNNATLSLNRGDTALNVGNSIHGTGTLSIDGSGSVTISGNSDYSGSTLINSGIAVLTSGTGLGSTSTGTAVASGGQLYVTANVNLAEPLTISGNGPDSNGALRKGGAGLTVEAAPVSLAADSSVGIDTGSTLVISNAITGGFGLTALGGGTLTLTTNSSLSGFTLNGSIVNVGTSGALGTNPVTVSGAGRFVIADGLKITNDFTVSTVNPGSATGLLMVNNNTNGTVTTVSGSVTLGASPATGGDFFGPTSSGYLNVTGPVTNIVTGLVSSRNGLVRFSGGGDYTSFILNQGTVSLGANNGLCPNTALQLSASGASVFDLNGFSQTLTGLNDGAANSKLVTNSTATLSTLTMNLPAGSSFSGVIAGNVALVENGSANLWLSGTNAYTGNTTINGGTLELAVASLAANSTITVASGAGLQLDFSVTNTVAGLVLNGVTQAPGVYSAATSSPYIAGSGSLLVAAAVNPNPPPILTTFDGTHLGLSWPTNVGWILQSQTNTLSVGLSTNWVDVTGSAALTGVTNAVNPANGSVFYRLRLP
jgi:autotransporter-associated beta strand protein